MPRVAFDAHTVFRKNRLVGRVDINAEKHARAVEEPKKGSSASGAGGGVPTTFRLSPLNFTRYINYVTVTSPFAHVGESKRRETGAYLLRIPHPLKPRAKSPRGDYGTHCRERRRWLERGTSGATQYTRATTPPEGSARMSRV